MNTFRALCVVALSLALGGCAEFNLRQKERQMELIARDWSMTIRASQVIPVYPLSQDFMPGDVFVVQMPIAEQSRRYRDRGFLPTDLQAARLGSGGYQDFYKAFEKGDKGDLGPLVLPRDWRVGPPAGSISGAIQEPDQGQGAKKSFGRPWSTFPRVGFPSYTFEVSNQGGLSAALPIQGIPVAFSATGAARATGSVTIADAVSYGLDANALYDTLSEFLQSKASRGLKPPPGEIWYLRVVTRVFAAKRFDIVLTATSTFGAGADVGAPKAVANTEAPKPLALPEGLNDAPKETQDIVNKDLKAQADARSEQVNRAKAEQGGQALQGGLTVDAMNARLKALEGSPQTTPPSGENGVTSGIANAAAGLVPGASLRATFASGRTIGFQETYNEPIVVGYHGFDVAIDSDGNIGAIVPSFTVMDNAQTVPSPTALNTDDALYMALIRSLRSVESSNPAAVESVLSKAASRAPGLDAEYKKVRSKGVGAWVTASTSWINQAPAHNREDNAAERTRQVRRWLAGEVKEAEIDLKAPPTPAVKPATPANPPPPVTQPPAQPSTPKPATPQPTK